MKKVIIILCFSLQIAFAQAQKTTFANPPIKAINDICWTLVDQYKPESDSVKNNCWSGCVFIRFKINKNHQFTNIDYTQSTPTFIKQALTKAFTVINMKAKSANKIPLLSDDVCILPLIIFNNQGCGFMTGWEDKNYKPDSKTEEIYKMRQDNYRQSTKSIIDILNFSKTKLGSLKCILLSPIIIGGVIN